LSEKSDVLIIGGGVIGVCTAYYLQQLGRQVTLVEKGEIASGSSHANAGMIVPGHAVPIAAPGVLTQGLKWMLNADSPFYIKPRLDSALFAWLWRFWRASGQKQYLSGLDALNDLAADSMELYKSLIVDENLDCSFEQKGWLVAYKTPRKLIEAADEANHLQQTYGVETQILDEVEARALAPLLRPGLAGGILFPSEAHLDSARFVEELTARLEAAGAAIHTGTEVTEIVKAGEKITTVRTSAGDFQAEQVVLAGGAWSPELIRSLGTDLPIQPAKGYSITLKKHATDPTLPISLSEARVVVTPLDNALRLAGTLELGGMDEGINQRRVRAIWNTANSYLDLQAEIEESAIWYGLRPCTPDGLPVISQAENTKNLFIAAGHCMLGMTLGPATGKLIAGMVCGMEPELNPAPFDIARF